MPNFSQKSYKNSITHIIGIDEAGRGPLAGPVAVGAVKISKKFNKKLLKNIRDSKKLTERAREDWYRKLRAWQKENLLSYHVSLIRATTIDEKGISAAIRKAIKFCLRKIEADFRTSLILLDGSLYAPREFLYQKTIIGGDDIESAISLASIAAKVKRDRYMKNQAKKYPNYFFEIHKGYGTKLHRDSIKKYGICELHRRSFLKNIIT